jgi:Na+-driven multidrug efflux pump
VAAAVAAVVCVVAVEVVQLFVGSVVVVVVGGGIGLLGFCFSFLRGEFNISTAKAREVGDSDVVLLDVFVWSMPRNMAYKVVTVLLFLRSTNWRKRKNRKKNRFYFNFQEHT